MKHTKSIRAVPGGWTITDSHLSPDNSLLAYAVMSPTVFLASTGEGDADQRSVYFGNDRGSNDWHDHYGIWSCRFSADGKELVAGGSGKLMGEWFDKPELRVVHPVPSLRLDCRQTIRQD
jgi:WD repeat-containing protein 23